MTNKLKVDEVRAEGLNPTGTKATLVQRLESALRQENESSMDISTTNDSAYKKRRPREFGIDGSNGHGEIKSIEDNREMGIRQLRDQAVLRGILASGSKKEHLERLCTDSEKDVTEGIEGDEEVDASQKGKQVTNTAKGAAVLDQYLPDGIKAQYRVLQHEDEIYDAMLNQTEVGENNNKFYLVQEKLNTLMENQPQETKLEPRIAKFISLICNVSMMKQQMMGIGYNAEKLLPCRLSKSTILKGYDVLKRIPDVIAQADRKKLEQLSGEFHTINPHDFGFRKMSEFIVDTNYKLKCKLEMVETQGEIEVATSLIKEDPLYSYYQCLGCELTPLQVDSKEFSMIERYIQNTGAKTHYNVDIVQIFRASREGESERFKKFSRTKNRVLLWHGSRLTNWSGILSQGLRIAPPEAPSSGYSFGKGVYFSDMFSNSASYCQANCAAKDGVLLLCEVCSLSNMDITIITEGALAFRVALGDMAELLACNDNADKLPKGKLSTKGVGRIAPDSSEAQVLEDGVIVPLGKPKEQPEPKGACEYNEYIVYNVDQIRTRYVVHVNFRIT